MKKRILTVLICIMQLTLIYAQDSFSEKQINTIPIVNFSASDRLITMGQSINFSDQSQNTPLQWNWTFQGGFPSASTLQNPTGIIYSSPGWYSTTLCATNVDGTNCLTKTEYIIVTGVPIPSYCDTISNIEISESLNYLKLTNTWGYLPGHNGLNINAYAEKFVNYTFSEITSLIIAVQKRTATSTSSIIRFKIWSGIDSPQVELGFQDVYLNSMSPNFYKLVTFSNPVQVDGTFFVGYELTYSTPQDTFVPAMASDRGPSGLNTLYVKNANNSWLSCPDVFNVHTSLAIDAQGCLMDNSTVNLISNYNDDKIIIIYQIPSSKIINIEFSEISASRDIDIKIYDLLGKEIYVQKFKISEKNYQIDFSSQETGIYVINLKNANGFYSKKVSIIK